MMLSFLGRYADMGLLLLRLGLGSMFVLHGAPKIMAGPETWAGLGAAMSNLGVTAVPAFWGVMAALSECGGGLCLILGVAFRPACILMAMTMGVAATYHLGKGDGVAGASHAIEDGVVFLSLILIGPGKHSIDGR